MAIETPKYKVIKKDGIIEIREYDDYIVAETTGSFIDLFNYISGANSKKQKIAMTAPVMDIFSDKGNSMAFIMPKTYNKEDLPEPQNENIELKKITRSRVGVIRFSGILRATRAEAMTEKLINWLDRNNYRRISSPKWARYNPPFTLPFIRRNEIHIEVEKNLR